MADTSDLPGRLTLSGLPAELRNVICRLVLVQPNTIYLGRNIEHTRHSLLQTNRQLRFEAASVFYGLNTFSTPPVYTHLGTGLTFSIPNKDTSGQDRMMQFVERLGPQLLPLCKSLVTTSRQLQHSKKCLRSSTTPSLLYTRLFIEFSNRSIEAPGLKNCTESCRTKKALEMVEIDLEKLQWGAFPERPPLSAEATATEIESRRSEDALRMLVDENNLEWTIEAIIDIGRIGSRPDR